ncbi:hypothetical protein BH10BAC2_BH10BAC2_38090 [soil metagenome]
MIVSTLLKVFFCICILIVPKKIAAQSSKTIDSLKNIIATTKNDTIRLEALVSLNKNLNLDRKQLTENLKMQIVLAKKLKNFKVACDAYPFLAYFEFENNNFLAAENITKEGMDLAKMGNDSFTIARLTDRLMLIYDKKGDMAAAMSNAKLTEELLIKLNRMPALATHYCNVSDVYVNHNMVTQALEYARMAYATAKSTNAFDITTVCWYLASRLQMTGKYDSAIHYFSDGLSIAEKLGYAYTGADMLRGLSDVYSELKQYDVARDYLKKAMDSYNSVKVTDRVTNCEESLTFLNFMNKDFEKVRNYIHIREKKATEDTLNNKKFIAKWLANLALINKDVESWKKYQREYEQAEAKLTNDMIQKSILELEAKYNLSKKENELLQKDIENRKRLWIIAALAIVIVSILIIVATQYRNYKNTQKIAFQKAIIEKQNALEYERLRIAADMHDDVGAGLSRIRYITSALHAGNEVSNEDINRIVSLSDESVEKMNEIIWSLNQGNRTIEELIYHIRSQCASMVSNANLAFNSELPNNIPATNTGWNEGRNIYMLTKEAVNNAIKHAQATTISIEFLFSHHLLTIIVADNGKGFNIADARKEGNGLKNYEKRMAVLNGAYHIDTINSGGTRVVFTIPSNAS